MIRRRNVTSRALACSSTDLVRGKDWESQMSRLLLRLAGRCPSRGRLAPGLAGAFGLAASVLAPLAVALALAGMGPVPSPRPGRALAGPRVRRAGAVRGRRVDQVMGEVLKWAGQLAGVCGGGAAQPDRRRDQRASQPDGAWDGHPGPPLPGRPLCSGRDAGRGWVARKAQS